MTTNPSVEELHNFESAHKEDLAAVTQILAKITKRSSEEIKPHLDTMLERLVKPEERPFYETATPEEWVRAFQEWASCHALDSPLLSDYAVSRESMYDDERL